ncbi:MAG: type III pantothenate kinase, partial [Sphingomonas sp.]|nr:type III pantothenate kinase [Sphingomonas sp.]
MAAASQRKSDYLLIDISNSFTKLAFSSQHRVARPSRLRTQGVTIAAIKRLLAERSVRAVVVSSVVPAKNGAISKAAGAVRVVFVGAKTDLGVGIDYPTPASIGADRLANA